jgi:hypothetical protein
MRHCFAIVIAAAALLASPPAYAAKPIVTPVLPPTAAGSLQCWVVNASETKTVEVEIEIRAAAGTIDESGSATIGPGGSNALASMVDGSRYCVVRVTRGGKQNVRVSLVAIEGGAPLAVVHGQ